VKFGEAIIVTAVYFFWAAALISVGITQLPLEKPECAAPADSVVSLKAWGEVPLVRFEAVWCDMGALAGVGLGFLGFCNFSFVSAMLFNKMVKQDHEAELLAKGLKQKKEAIVMAQRRSTVRQSIAIRQSQIGDLPGTPLGLPRRESSANLGSKRGSTLSLTHRGSMASLALPPVPEADSETKPKVNHRYHKEDHVTKEDAPLPVYEDYDGRLFDI
jgi:hypothetical protein